MVVGLDFGESALKMALWDGKKLVRLAEEPMPDQMVRAGVVLSPEAMAPFLKDALKKNRISARKAAVILPDSQVFVQRTELPPMTEAQLRLNLPYEFHDYISDDKDKYYYDYSLVSMVTGANGEPVTMRLLAAAVSKELIASYRDMCRWAGLKLSVAIPVEMAYCNLIRAYQKANPTRKGVDRCIVDLGHTGSRVSFFTGDAFTVASSGEIGGGGVDTLLSEAFQADIHIAHARKHSNKEGELELPQVLDLFQDNMRDIQRAINFYNYNNPDRELGEAWVCGGGSRMTGQMEALKAISDLRFRPITELIGVDDPLAAVCAAAIGAAIQ